MEYVWTHRNNHLVQADRLSRSDDVVTIGQPLANTEIYILDAEGRPQINGDIGEVCIGGAGMKMESWNSMAELIIK
jgi:non-ribosomal peptide synthetase component F